MNAKTLEAITRHGNALLAAFPNATEQNPVALCKKLRRIENAVSRVTTDYCNGDATLEQCDKACESAASRVEKLLPQITQGLKKLWINRDPRGHALKLDDAWVRDWNHRQYVNNQPTIHTDMGGYGILAPDLNQ